MASPALDVLDLDDLGAPVGQQRRRGRHEGVLGDLEDADALEDCGHGRAPVFRSWSAFSNIRATWSTASSSEHSIRALDQPDLREAVRQRAERGSRDDRIELGIRQLAALELSDESATCSA